MNPKIRRDPYLRAVHARWGEAAVYEAGFFEDTDPADAPLDDVNWLCTPTAVVRDGLQAGRGAASGPPVVLLSTGGFFPVHDGHLAMMRAARERAAAAGWWVVGGYLSPADDEYIARKCGSVPIGVSQRLARAHAAVHADAHADHPARDWLSIDPWEALARRVAVNYTDVTARLQAYLRAQVRPDIEVAFVAGGDNARFALAFAPHGRCIVVDRPGCEATVARWRTDDRIPTDGRILWAPGGADLASSALRPVVWSTTPPHLLVRLEDARSVRTLGLPATTWAWFQQDLLAELACHLRVTGRAVEPPDGPPSSPSSSPGPGPGPGVRTLSLDPLVPGDADLAISRVFDLGGYRPLGHAARPGHPPLATQLAALAPGAWRLLDDDRATGSTEAFVRAQVPADVTIAEAVFAVDARRGSRVDIADSRDFLLGSDDGGLVLALADGRLGRAPYLLPFVDPSVRCGLPGTDSLAFSRSVWARNAAVFAPTRLTVADLPPPAMHTVLAAGAALTDLLVALCQRYADALSALQGATPPTST